VFLGGHASPSTLSIAPHQSTLNHFGQGDFTNRRVGIAGPLSAVLAAQMGNTNQVMPGFDQMPEKTQRVRLHWRFTTAQKSRSVCLAKASIKSPTWATPSYMPSPVTTPLGTPLGTLTWLTYEPPPRILTSTL
jgi:hypothetical protein